MTDLCIMLLQIKMISLGLMGLLSQCENCGLKAVTSVSQLLIIAVAMLLLMLIIAVAMLLLMLLSKMLILRNAVNK